MVLINNGSQLSGFQTPQGSRVASAVQDRHLISVGCQEETLLAMGNQHTGVDLLLTLLYLRDIENSPSSVWQSCVFFVDSSIKMQWAEAFDCYPNGWHSDIFIILYVAGVLPWHGSQCTVFCLTHLFDGSRQSFTIRPKVWSQGHFKIMKSNSPCQ